MKIKQTTNKVKSFIVNFFIKVSQNFHNSSEKQSKKQFEKLTPTILKASEIQTYTDALDFVFRNDDIINIALTGSYGAGKSTIIKSYEQNAKFKRKYVYISLANFDNDPIHEKDVLSENQETDGDSQAIKFDAKQLEGKILNQFIHQINSEKVPLTRFKIKNPIKHYKVWIYALWFLTETVLLTYNLTFEKITEIINAFEKSDIKSIFAPVLWGEARLASLAVFFLLLIPILYRIIVSQMTRNFLQRVKSPKRKLNYLSKRKNHILISI